MTKNKYIYFLTFFFLILFIVIAVPTIRHKIKKQVKKQSIHAHGYWTDSYNENLFDKGLSDALITYLNDNNANTCVDFGCGTSAYYVRYLNKNHFLCDGFDGNPNSFKISKGLVKIQDLAESFHLDKKYDFVISLEVAEHIPKEYEKIYIENLHRHNAQGIIISWARIGQGGRGHVNEKDNISVKKIFENLGYVNDVEGENFLRSKAQLKHFKNTVMIFKKN